jgi:hypothetical protein
VTPSGDSGLICNVWLTSSVYCNPIYCLLRYSAACSGDNGGVRGKAVAVVVVVSAEVLSTLVVLIASTSKHRISLEKNMALHTEAKFG